MRTDIVNTLKKLILFLSDQQLVTGIALLATAQVKICDISKYHYETTLVLATISCAVHSKTIIVLRKCMLNDTFVWIFRVLRVLVHHALALIATIRIRGSINNALQGDPRWPILCFFSLVASQDVDVQEGYPLKLFNLVRFIILVKSLLISSGRYQ